MKNDDKELKEKYKVESETETKRYKDLEKKNSDLSEWAKSKL